jgi:hypothetical protein
MSFLLPIIDFQFICYPRGTAASWKTLLGAKKHRLEAYATLFFGLLSDLFRTIL